MKLEKIEKYYDKFLFSCQFLEINKNGIYYLKGKNGVGKSTLLKMISGQDLNYEGQIKEVTSVSIYQQNSLFLPHLTFKQNLDLIEPYNKNIVQELLNLLEVAHLTNKKSSCLSLGEKQRLELILALSKDVSIYLLDEPFSSLNSKYINEIKTFLEKMSLQKIIIISSHTKLSFSFTGIISISNRKIELIKQQEGIVNTKTFSNNKNKISLKKLKYFIFNKGLFFLSFINLISAFALLLISLNFQKEIFKNIEKENNFTNVYVIEKYNREGNVDQFLSSLRNYECHNNICSFQLKGNQETLNKLNKEYPYLYFYSLENEAIDNIKIKLENILQKFEYILLITFLFSFMIIFLSEFLSYILNKKKHLILKYHLDQYWQYLIIYYAILILSSFLISKILVKILYKFLLS